MKILLVIHDFLPKHLAGSELYTYHLAKGLQDRGHEVSIYTREHGHYDKQFTEEDSYYDGLKVKTVYFNSLKNKESGGLLQKFRLDFYVPFLQQRFNEGLDNLIGKFYLDFYNPVIAKHFNKYLDEIKPDVVHLQHLMGLSASFISLARKKGIPCILTAHDYWFMCSTIQLFNTSSQRCSGPLNGFRCPKCLVPTLSSRIVRSFYPLFAIPFFARTFYLKRLLNKVDMILAPSYFLRNKFIEHGISEKKIVFSDYGMRTNSLKLNNRHRHNMLRFGFIGSVMPHKGVHVLIEAFNKIKNGSAELQIYGDPAYAPAYYERLTKAATHPLIKFMGRFDNDQVYEILAGIDVLVVPSIWYENSPLTIHEAALAGVPVITSDIGGMDELIERLKNGLVFRVGDADDLYEKIGLLIDKPGFLEQLKCQAEKIKTMDENVREIESIYLRLAENRQTK